MTFLWGCVLHAKCDDGAIAGQEGGRARRRPGPGQGPWRGPAHTRGALLIPHHKTQHADCKIICKTGT